MWTNSKKKILVAELLITACCFVVAGLAHATPVVPGGTTPYAWYRADMGVNKTGATVTSWEDQSGNGRTLAASGDPQYTSDGIGGLPAITFDGNGDYLEGTKAAWGTAASGTVFAAWRLTGQTAVGSVEYLYDGGITDQGRQAILRDDPGAWEYGGAFPNNFVTFDPTATAGAPDPDNAAWVVSAATHTGTDTLRLNQVQVASGNAASNPGMDGILVGAFVIPNRHFWNGQITELVVFEGTLSGAERDAIEQALYTRWVVPLEVNVVNNPGAELDPGTGDWSQNIAISGWNDTSEVTALHYADKGGPGWVPNAIPGGGNNLFYAGNVPRDTEISQSIKVSNYAAVIDAGSLQYELSGWFGGYLGENDDATLIATFLDELGDPIGTAVEIGGFSAADRGNVTSLLFDSALGRFPAGTRDVSLRLLFGQSHVGTDGMADNLSLVLRIVPEPASILLLVLGALVSLSVARRRSTR